MITTNHILLTNDDGISAPGIVALEQSLSGIGETLHTVAPLHEKSGCGHSITLISPLRVRPMGHNRYAIDGSPADCVYIGMNELIKPRPTLLISGINRGANLANDLTYSGTVAGAIEGFYQGATGIAVSLYSPKFENIIAGHFELAAALFAKKILPYIFSTFPDLSLNPRLFNINIPESALAAANPEIAWTSLGKRLYGGEVIRRDDPRGFPYFWIGGTQHRFADIPGSDCNAILEGKISITPLSIALTDQTTLALLRK